MRGAPAIRLRARSLIISMRVGLSRPRPARRQRGSREYRYLASCWRLLIRSRRLAISPPAAYEYRRMTITRGEFSAHGTRMILSRFGISLPALPLASALKAGRRRRRFSSAFSYFVDISVIDSSSSWT